MIFVGDDWAEDHHDVHLMDETGARLASRRLPEGLAGIGEFHQLLARYVEEPDQVVIGIETDRGLWVTRWLRPATRCMRSTRWRPPATATATMSREPSPMPGTPNSWLIWCAPTGTTTARSPETPRMPRRSRCWPGHIRI